MMDWANDIRPGLVDARDQLQAKVDSINAALSGFTDPDVYEKWEHLRDSLVWIIAGINQQIAYGDLFLGVVGGA